MLVEPHVAAMVHPKRKVLVMVMVPPKRKVLVMVMVPPKRMLLLLLLEDTVTVVLHVLAMALEMEFSPPVLTESGLLLDMKKLMMAQKKKCFKRSTPPT